MKAICTFALVGIVLVLVQASWAVEMPVQVEEKVLANGLKVFAVKRPGVPQAACVMAARVGAVAEVPGRTGIAHFTEHMMFKGTDKIGVKDAKKDRGLRREIDAVVAKIMALEDEGAPEEALAPLKKERDRLFKEQQENLEINHIFRIYSEAGGAMTNAFTSNDMTAYFSLLPPNKIELFFWVEAERFRRPVFRQFHSEKDVVREERRLSENRPGHAFREEMARVVFGSHPYSHPVLGYHEDVRRLTREHMREFFATHYTPDNMFLMVAGDVDPADVFALAEKYFGSWEPYRGKRRKIPMFQVTRSGSSRVYGHGPGTPSLSVAYRLPASGTQEEVACEMIAMHLGDQEGDLRNKLVKEKGIATSVGAHFDGRKYGGLLRIRVEMKPDGHPESAEQDVLEAVQRLVEAPLPESAVRDLAQRYRADMLGAFKNEMRVGFLFLHREIVGSWKDIGNLIDKAMAITPEEIHEVASAYLVRDNRVVGVYEKEARPPVSAPPVRPKEPRITVKKEKAIAPSWKDLEFKDAEVKIPDAGDYVATLSNGIRVVVVPDRFDPVFRITAVLAGGSSQDPEGKEGMHDLLASVANRFALPGMTRLAIRRKLEKLVGEMDVSSDFHSLSLALDTFKEDRDEGLKLFKALLLDAVLDEDVFETERERLKSDLVDEDARPRSVCGRTYRERLWGKIRRTRRATPASLDAIGMKDLEAALASHRDPRRCILAVSGDFERKAMLRYLEDLFGDWKAPEGPVPGLASGTPAEPAKGLHVMDFPASQGYVMIGAPTVKRTHADYASLQFLSMVLSRRIFNRIRSNEGLAYQAGARLQGDWDLPSPFTVIFQTKARSVPFGIWLAMDELDRIRKEGPDEEEMARAHKQLGTSLQMALARGEGKASSFARLLLVAPENMDWYRKYWRAGRSVTADDVRLAAATYLESGELLILCVGKRAGMEEGDGEHANALADFGPATVIEAPKHDLDPKTPRDVVLHLIRLLSAGDVEGMKPYLAEAYRKRLETPGTARQMKMQGRFLGQAKYEIVECEEEGDRASVKVRFEVEMGEQAMKMIMGFDLERAGGKWVCSGFKPVR